MYLVSELAKKRKMIVFCTTSLSTRRGVKNKLKSKTYLVKKEIRELETVFSCLGTELQRNANTLGLLESMPN